jgi:hypothetical protein
MYLYSDDALAKIREFAPSARIIAMLRNPLDLAHSYHAEMHLNGNEDQSNFEAAWRLQAARMKGECIPRLNDDPRVLQYRAIASLGTQMKRLFSLFPRQQIKVLLFDEMVSATHKYYVDTLEFLGLSDDGRTDFTARREARRHLVPAIGQRLRKAPPRLRRLHAHFKRVFGIESTRIADLLTVKGRKRPLPTALRDELRSDFRDEVALLSDVIDRDLSSWQ